MPVDIVKLLKTQDVGYVRTLLSTEEKVGRGAAIAIEGRSSAYGALQAYESKDNRLRRCLHYLSSLVL
jgi:hypothetical protein